MTNLKKLSRQKKEAMLIICNKGKFEYTKQLFQLNKILNVYTAFPLISAPSAC